MLLKGRDNHKKLELKKKKKNRKQMRDVAAYNQQDVLGDGCFLFEFH